jgi:putative heme-binding domain-containing protein
MNTFGKEHSTALCGVVYYAADQFPPEYQGKMFLGDVVENRINAYRLEWNGATPKAIFEPFLTSSDPWFRPVDIKLGPDGCIYFADFYNRIIGHYEVDLKHPGRDRDKGRIWRIVYRGKPGEPPGVSPRVGPQPVVNLANADVKSLVQALGHTNLTVRLQATHQLAERGGNEAVAALQPIVKDIALEGDAARKSHALWVLERLGKLDDEVLASASSAQEKAVRVHAQRILGEKANWSPKYAAIAKLGLDDKEAVVQRVAAEALAAHPAADQIGAILLMSRKIPVGDNHLSYAARLALRDQLRAPDAWKTVKRSDLRDDDLNRIAEVCLSIASEPSAAFLQAQLERRLNEFSKPDPVPGQIQFIVRNGGEGSASWALDYAGRKYARQLTGQGNVLKAVIQATQERGRTLGEQERAAGEGIVLALIAAPSVGDKQLGAELAGTLRLTRLQPRLLELINQTAIPEPVRKTCIVSLVNIDSKKAVSVLATILLSDKEGIAIREQTANALAGTNHPEAHAALMEALQNAPARLQSTIALGMAASPQGGERLLQAIEAGKASPRLLQDRAVEIRLQNAKIASVNERLKKLTQGLPPADQKAQEVISKRRDAFASFKSDAGAGHKIFQKHCAACHQIANQGAKVGPNLDGIGVRGLERLLEDVIDPNRNVDQAFRSTIITTKGGQTVSGLFLREEGNVVILADKDGKDVRIEKGQIDDRSLSPLSPMPSNFNEALSEPELHHLMAYLLEQRGKM